MKSSNTYGCLFLTIMIGWVCAFLAKCNSNITEVTEEIYNEHTTGPAPYIPPRDSTKPERAKAYQPRHKPNIDRKAYHFGYDEGYSRGYDDGISGSGYGDSYDDYCYLDNLNSSQYADGYLDGYSDGYAEGSADQ